jgi:hypothetical protein
VVTAILGYSLLNPVFSERAAFWIPLLIAAAMTLRSADLEDKSESVERASIAAHL